MKKVFSLAALLLALFSVIVFADEEPEFTRVGIHFQVECDQYIKDQTLTFELLDGDTGASLCNRYASVNETASRWIGLEFETPPFKAGKSFVLHMVCGEGQMEFNGLSGREFELQTYSAPNQTGNLDYVTDFYMLLRPQGEKSVRVSLDGEMSDGIPVYERPNGLMVPFYVFDKLGVNSVLWSDGGLHMSCGKLFITVYENQLCAYKNSGAFNMGIAPEYIDGVMCVPVVDVAEAFDCPIKYSDNGRDLRLFLGRCSEAFSITEKLINSRNIASQTDYMVWVSKSEYTVRVFRRKEGSWRMVNSFLCAIGAPSSPTCEGTYRYYQYQTRWEYPNYYCGPIMRFNGGFAIHSTLRRYDGSDYDGRVGMKISHGCIRVRPENIAWLVDTVPLYSTIYITA